MPIDHNYKDGTRYVPNKKRMEAVLATPNKTLPSGAKLILLNLMHRLGGKRTCWPSQKRIAADLGISDRQVRNHLKLLESKGIIRKAKRGFKSTRIHRNTTRSTEYDLGRVLVMKNKKDSTSKETYRGNVVQPTMEKNDNETGKEVPTNDK